MIYPFLILIGILVSMAVMFIYSFLYTRMIGGNEGISNYALLSGAALFSCFILIGVLSSFLETAVGREMTDIVYGCNMSGTVIGIIVFCLIKYFRSDFLNEEGKDIAQIQKNIAEKRKQEQIEAAQKAEEARKAKENESTDQRKIGDGDCTIRYDVCLIFHASMRIRYLITASEINARMWKVVLLAGQRELSYSICDKKVDRSDFERFARLVEREFGWAQQEIKDQSYYHSWSDYYDLDDDDCPDYGINNDIMLGIQTEYVSKYVAEYSAGKLSDTNGTIELSLKNPPKDTKKLDDEIVLVMYEFWGETHKAEEARKAEAYAKKT